LAREVNVGAIREDHGDDGEACTRNRTHFLDIRQRIHHGFDGIGNELLNLSGCQTPGFGVDDDLNVRDIRKGVEIETRKEEKCRNEEAYEAEHHEKPAGNCASNDPI
jgi:hypothetical protein